MQRQCAFPPASTEDQPLSPTLLAETERFFDADLSAVRVRRTAALGRIGAIACTTGELICLDLEAADAGSLAGRYLLGHELAHILQQREGRATGEGLLLDMSLEAEAELLGTAFYAAPFPGRRPAAARRPRRCPVQPVINYPAWWNGAPATIVEGYIAANASPFPNNLAL